MTAASVPAQRPAPLAWPRPRQALGDFVAVARLVTFAALAALVAWRWLNLISPPPAGQGVAAVAIILVEAAAISSIARLPLHRGLRVLAGVAVAVAATLLALVAIGLPAHTLVPAGWGQLGHGLRIGLDGAFGGDYPYIGPEWWTGMVILAGLPLVLGIGAALAFARRDGGRPRAVSLALLLGAWATATALVPPPDPVLAGIALFFAVAGWLWLERAPRAGAVPAALLLAAAAALAIPIATALDRGRPVFDYRNWDFSFSGAASQSVSYSWDHTYGPLRWPRTGHTLFTVTGSSPQYWRATTLDQFDGLRWVASSDPGGARFQLPAAAESARSVADRVASLDPRWVYTANFSIDDLSSQLLVAPGTVLRWRGLNDAVAAPNEVTLPTSHQLADGSSYSVLAYEPDPSPGQLRHAPRGLAPGLRRYTEIGLPRITRSLGPTDARGRPIQVGRGSSASVNVRTVEMPLYGERPRGGRPDVARRALAGSVYGDIYRLSRRVTAGAATEYGAVRAVENHLRHGYTYNESPPLRQLPLRAFLFRDRRGYCQQFSGAMALMLRTLGIPARVASGFSPGIPNPHGNGFAVRDLDAHSWVEVYFDGIGWVPFDPTPASAPASSQFAAPTKTQIVARGPSRQLANQPGGNERVGLTQPVTAGDGSGVGPWPWIGAALTLLVAAVVVAAARRRARHRAMSPAAAAAAQARELSALIQRLGLDRRRAITLLDLERRLGTIAGPDASAYAGALRRARFGPGGGKPPTLGDRRRLRRALFGGLGLRGRLSGLFAIPPGGPR